DWRFDEVVANVYLLACALFNAAEEHLRGPSLRLSSRIADTPPGRLARFFAEDLSPKRFTGRLAETRQWRDRWLAALDAFLAARIAGDARGRGALLAAAASLASLLKTPLPATLARRAISIPSPFRRLDLTIEDVIALGERYAERFPPRGSRPILFVGLRTAGSYLVPVLRALFASRGYDAVAMMTLAPSKGVSRREQSELARFASQGYTAVVVDDPPHTGGAVHTGLDIVRRAGFAQCRLLVPTHPARPHLFDELPADLVVTLPPEAWHKRKLLSPEYAQVRLDEYFRGQGFDSVRLIPCETTDRINARLDQDAAGERGTRLKKVFKVELRRADYRETRMVLAKSVGFGWLGYCAFLGGHRLAEFVPPLFGLRDGILTMEWIANETTVAEPDAGARIDTAASYVAARTRLLGLGATAAANVEGRQTNAFKLLARSLANAFGKFPVNLLKRPALARLIERSRCPFPTFIDGNMEASEWLIGPSGVLKVDYEHHGLGKEELNIVDPAYDLADIVLNWKLSAADEHRLVTRYIAQSGDSNVEQRLMLHKLLAGLWAMKKAHDRLFDKASTLTQQQACHQQFLTAWDFLTVQAARHLGGTLARRQPAPWRSPIFFSDIDGVIDERPLGFPTTTPAGIEALGLLNANGIPVALNSARSLAEIKAYCEAYALSGGVAEHGSYVWDAVNQCGQQLISAQALEQLDRLKAHLRALPGVFLDERHEFSIRAFSYVEKPRGTKQKILAHLKSGTGDALLAPISTLLVRRVMTELRLDLITYHPSQIAPTFGAKGVPKRSRLVALRHLVLGPH